MEELWLDEERSLLSGCLTQHSPILSLISLEGRPEPGASWVGGRLRSSSERGSAIVARSSVGTLSVEAIV